MFETYSIVYKKIIYISDKGSGNLIGNISIIHWKKNGVFSPKKLHFFPNYSFDAQAQKHIQQSGRFTFNYFGQIIFPNQHKDVFM